MRIIAIDPDVEKSGVAIYYTLTNEMELQSLTFPKLVDFFYTLSKIDNSDVKVYVEAGWMNKTNWHLTRFDSKQAAAAKGNATGRNHEVGRKLIEMCDHWGIYCRPVKPLRKCWRGHDRKITHKEMANVFASRGIKPPKQSNQEERDAALIAIQTSIIQTSKYL